jgi:ubiquinol-cytochrome c reductase cytochrome b/c1 subunit
MAIMKLIRKSLIPFAALVLVVGFGSAVHAAEGPRRAKDISYSFEGPLGKFDRGQLQRGYKVYKEVCSACHSMRLLSFRNLADPGGPEFTEEQVKALAATFETQDGPDDSGEMFTRPALPSDRFPSPFPNEQAARAASGGALPADLSLITKARAGYDTLRQLVGGTGGPEYVYSVLTGYEPEPPGLAAEKPEGTYYNPYFAAGHWISMPPPLSDDQVTFDDGAPSTVRDMARDVSAFLAWAAEPKLEERKALGFQVLIYLIVLCVLLYICKEKIWSRIEH